MTRGVAADQGLHLKRPNHISCISGTQSVGCIDERRHALFKTRVAFQLTLLQQLYPRNLRLQLRNFRINFLEADITMLLQYIEPHVSMPAKCIDISVDTHHGTAKMLHCSGNTCLKGQCEWRKNAWKVRGVVQHTCAIEETLSCPHPK